MKQKVQLGARVLLGLGFFIFGINGFLQFMPNPPVTAEAGALLGAFAKTGYFFPMIKIIEMLVGLLLLSITLIASDFLLLPKDKTLIFLLFAIFER